MSKGETYLIRRAASGDKPGELIRVPDEVVMLATGPQRQAAEDIAVAATGRDLAFVLFRHLRKSAAFFVVVFGLALLSAVLMPSSYRSDARLLVRLGAESMLPDPSVQIGRAVVTPIQNRTAEINTELQILRSREVAEAVIARLGVSRIFGGATTPMASVDANDPSVKAAIMQLDRKLLVEVEPDSNVISVQFESRRPDVSRDVVAAYVECFREIRARIHRNPLTARFFGEQQEEVRRQIEQLEQQIRHVKDATGVADLEEQRRVLVARAAALQTETDRVNQALIATQAGPNHPGRARLIALRQQQKEVDQAMQKLNDVSIRLRELERDFGVKTETFRQYASIAEQAGVDTAMGDNRLGNISVVQAASLPLKPSKPNRLVLLGVGLFLALSGAIGLAFVAEAMDHSVKRPEDLALMGVNRAVSIASIPELAARQRDPTPLPAASSVAAAAEGVIARRDATFSAGPWSAVDRTESPDDLSDAPRARGHAPVVWLHELRQGTRRLAEKLLINTAVDGTSPRVIAFVGGRAGHGTTTVACATATLLAERALLESPASADSAVLLIDADLHTPSLHQQLGVELSPGVTDWLADPGSAQTPLDAILHPTCVEGLTVMPAGALRGGGLTPSRLKRLIDLVAPNYRFVLVDLPPLDSSPEAARLSAVCDGTVLVIECEQVRKQVVIHTLATLSEADAHLLGAVLNKRHYPVPEWLYKRV